MWPVQTLTLLLCLTDEEQLFAQQQVQHPQLPALEATVPDEAPILPASTLVLFGEC